MKNKSKEKLIVIDFNKIDKRIKIDACKSNRIKGKYPYVKVNGLYTRPFGVNYAKATFLTPKQAKEINNLIKAKKLIDIEIAIILKQKNKK